MANKYDKWTIGLIQAALIATDLVLVVYLLSILHRLTVDLVGRCAFTHTFAKKGSQQRGENIENQGEGKWHNVERSHRNDKRHQWHWENQLWLCRHIVNQLRQKTDVLQVDLIVITLKLKDQMLTSVQMLEENHSLEAKLAMQYDKLEPLRSQLVDIKTRLTI